MVNDKFFLLLGINNNQILIRLSINQSMIFSIDPTNPVQYVPDGTEEMEPIRLLYNGYNHYDFIRIVNQQPQPQQQQPQRQRQIIANNEDLLRKAIVNRLIATESAQKMDCDALCIEFSCDDHDLINELGILNPNAHQWLLRRKSNYFRTRSPLEIDPDCEKILRNIEFIEPGWRPQIDYRNNNLDVVKFSDEDGAEYELAYPRLRSYARAIHEATMFVHKVNADASEVQIWIEKQSVERLATKKSE